jgi:hypothetical protein
MGFLLFIISVILIISLGFISLVFNIFYFFITLKWRGGSKVLGRWFAKIALSIDQLGNVVCGTPFNLSLIKRDSKDLFGGEDDTVSYILAKNFKTDSLTWLGRAISYLLDLIDRGHLQKALDKKKECDIEAAMRLNKNEY